MSGLQIVQVWSGNYKSYFGYFQICEECLYYKISRTVLHRKINFNCWLFIGYFCWLINCMSWMSYYFSYINCARYFRHVQKIKHCLCLKPYSVFIYGKLKSNYFFTFLAFFWSLNCASLVCRFFISFRTILYFWAVLIY